MDLLIRIDLTTLSSAATSLALCSTPVVLTVLIYLDVNVRILTRSHI